MKYFLFYVCKDTKSSEIYKKKRQKVYNLTFFYIEFKKK